jgi:hypothetical protein
VNGRIDLTRAYETGIGEWDKVAIRFGYMEVPDERNSHATLDTVLLNAARRGISFLTDQDARPTGSAHPQTHLWDNGRNSVTELERVLEVRGAALQRFGEKAIRTHAPLASMEEALVPLFLHHRYQTEAAVKTVGGQYYTYALRGDGQTAVRAAPAAEQARALDAVLRTIDPATLALPRALLTMIPPRPSGYPATVEMFDRYTGLVFDVITPAAAAADMTLSLLLDPERAARLVEQHALDASLPGLIAVLARINTAVFNGRPADAYHAEITRAVQRVYVDELMNLAARATMPQVRAIASYSLQRMAAELKGATGDDASLAHAYMMSTDITRFLDRPMPPITPSRPATLPPGQPIGDPGMSYLSLLWCDAW